MNRQHLPLHQHEAHALPMLHMPSIPNETTSQTYHVNFPLPLVSGVRVPCPVYLTAHILVPSHAMIYDITFAVCMIQMLLLLFRKESFLIALIVECLLAQWERNILQQKLVELKLPA
jgi:hypothetical protein